MPTRPTWSGSIQISLVSISVNIFPATNPGRQVEFHQIDRKTHKRVRHQNVDESGEVEKADIVKGFEYAKDKYIEIAPDELKALRIPTATTMPRMPSLGTMPLPRLSTSSTRDTPGCTKLAACMARSRVRPAPTGGRAPDS